MRQQATLRGALDWARLAPALRLAMWVVVLFAGGLWLARQFAEPLQQLLSEHAAWAVALFVASSALAVLVPVASNLPLVPLMVPVFGPWWTALSLLLGWLIGATASYALGRHAQRGVLRWLPSARRHADIDRLVRPGHRLLSLVSLRMTFPVDVLSYALGLFSRDTRAWEVALSTLIGAAPFALLFAWFPALSGAAQLWVLAVSVLAFAVHLVWVLRRSPGDQGMAEPPRGSPPR
ncbi:MAG: VTT domain-containing protein [Rubrivivax sp.]|nr:VTT domain-containing protein [Rubrivivax sp.]